MDNCIIDFEGMKFTPVRDVDGKVLRLVPIHPGTFASVTYFSEEEDLETSSESESEESFIETYEENFQYPSEDEVEEVPHLESEADEQREEAEEAPEFLEPREMRSRSTHEIDEPVEASSEELQVETAESISSVGSDSVEFSEEDFPLLTAEQKAKEVVVEEKALTFEVLYKPIYRTLKKLQMRSGPGPKYDSVAVIPAGVEVCVVADGLAECTNEMVQEWWELHVKDIPVPSLDGIQKLQVGWPKSKYALVDLKYSATQVESIWKQMCVANRKVKVAVNIDGEVKFGWISRRKNSGPMITRVLHGLPCVAVSSLHLFFDNEVLTFRERNNGCMPKKDFYKALLKNATGCDKVELQTRWIPDRKKGTEVKTLPKGRIQTGYYQVDSTAYLTWGSFKKAKAFIQKVNEKLAYGVKASFLEESCNLAPVALAECAPWSVRESYVVGENQRADIEILNTGEYQEIFVDGVRMEEVTKFLLN